MQIYTDLDVFTKPRKLGSPYYPEKWLGMLRILVHPHQPDLQAVFCYVARTMVVWNA